MSNIHVSYLFKIVLQLARLTSQLICAADTNVMSFGELCGDDVVQHWFVGGLGVQSDQDTCCVKENRLVWYKTKEVINLQFRRVCMENVNARIRRVRFSGHASFGCPRMCQVDIVFAY